MRINHNITALNTYNKLTANNAATTKSLEKLSSGLKINRAGDNAAGLAISEKMRGQIRGLDQSSANANDGISLIQTAEGALNETHSILQRMRELAVQSANDTNTDADRGEIQKEIDQLTQEIDRISTDTEFNTQKLLNGEKATKTNATNFKTALGSGKASIIKETIVEGNVKTGTYSATVSVSDAKGTVSTYVRATELTDANGAVSTFSVSGTTVAGTKTGVIVADATDSVDTGTLSVASGDSEDFFNAAGNTLGAGTYTLVHTVEGSGAADQYELRNASGTLLATGTGDTSGSASTTITFASLGSSTLTVTAGAEGDESAITVTAGFSMDGGTTVVSTGGKSASGVTVNVASDASFGDAFTIDVGAATAPTFTLSGADVKVGTYKLAVSNYNGTTLTADLTLQDEKGNVVKDADGKAYSLTAVSVSGTADDITFAGLGIDVNTIAGNSSSTFEITKAQTSTAVLKDAIGTVTTGVSFEFKENVADGDTFTIDVDADNAMKFQIGANESQNTLLSINEMGAEALGVDKIDLTSQATADQAITTVDKALSKVSSERAKLGAVQNRLEHTINNLGTSSENLSAAESRIRDVDMAKEMMEFTKNNILSQAAQSMLAQANQQPQGVLQLLQ